MIRVRLPYHLRTLAGVTGEVTLEVEGDPTLAALIDALEEAYPVLRGTVRDPVSGRRRPFIRFFACEMDVSHCDPADPLPAAVVSGVEPYFVIGAMAGG